MVASERNDIYMPLLIGKNVALVVNQSSLTDSGHLVDVLLAKGINLKKIFAPEHGFRGNIDRGKDFSGSVDAQTGLPIVAMYGKNKKPTAEQLADVDVVVFDIQDVGVRFFTYISSMHYVMEACAENNKQCVVLDRPNPLGDYVDGPVLEPEYRSFVGMHPIPIVHGLTVGELAQMINGEGWLPNGAQCELTVVPMKHYTHRMVYELPVKPSPNLPNYRSVRLYPSLCFFEATEVSVGRGTEFPFQVFGYPDSAWGRFSFVPIDMPGMQMDPLHEGVRCYGLDLRQPEDIQRFSLAYLLDAYAKWGRKASFFARPKWFDLLAGTADLQQQIVRGGNEAEIRGSWHAKLNDYKALRKKYLLYPD